MRQRFWVLLIMLIPFAAMGDTAEANGPVVRQGGLLGELRTFIASGLSGSGTPIFTTSATGWFTITEICANTTKTNQRDINVVVMAGDLHVTTLFEPQNGLQPKCVVFPTGMVLPRNTTVTCVGGSGHECWVTGVCSRDCVLPAN